MGEAGSLASLVFFSYYVLHIEGSVMHENDDALVEYKVDKVSYFGFALFPYEQTT